MLLRKMKKPEIMKLHRCHNPLSTMLFPKLNNPSLNKQTQTSTSNRQLTHASKPRTQT